MSSRWPDEQTLLRRQHFYIKALRSSTMRILNVGDGQSWHDIQVLSGPRSYQVYTWRESAGLRILKGAHRLSRNMPKRTGRPRASCLSRKSQSLHSTLPESACPWRRCGRVRQAEGERLRQLKDLFAKLGVQRPFVCNSQAAAPLGSPVGVPKVCVQIDLNCSNWLRDDTRGRGHWSGLDQRRN